MKTKKWLNYTLGILLTLIVLTAVAGAGFRAGMTQNIPFRQRPAFTHDISGAPQGMQGNFQKGGMPQDFQRQAFDNNRGFDRRDGGFSFFSPVFWVIRLAVLGLLVWVGYKFVKKSGWKLSLSKSSPAPSPTPIETPIVEVEEKKEAE